MPLTVQPQHAARVCAVALALRAKQEPGLGLSGANPTRDAYAWGADILAAIARGEMVLSRASDLNSNAGNVG